MKLAALESPYAPNKNRNRSVEDNIKYARECMRDCIERGYAPIAPHLLYTQDGILDDKNPVERSLGISMWLEWARLANVAVFYTDFGMSNGMQYAHDIYERENVPIEIRTIY